MIIFGKIFRFITNPKNIKIVLYAAGIIFLILFLKQCNSKSYWKAQAEIEKNEKQRVQNNYDAAQDTIKQKKLDENTWIAEKAGFELTLDELKENYADLLDNFEFEKNKPPKTIIKTVYEIKDSIKEVPVLVETDSLGNTSLAFSDSTYHDSTMTNYRFLVGKIPYKIVFDKKDSLYKVVPDKADINLTIGMNLNLGLFQDEKTKKINIQATTDYPGVTFTDISGASIMDDPKNKKMFRQMRKPWGLGVNIGYGLLLDYKAGTIATGPYVGLGLSYSPKWLQWGR